MSLNKIFNEKVVSAQPVQRDKEGCGAVGIKHSGTVLTTESGNPYLQHKGPGYSQKNDTVITPASNMSNKWSNVGKSYNPQSNVGGMMNSGAYDYLKSNCNHSTGSQKNSTVQASKLGHRIDPK